MAAYAQDLRERVWRASERGESPSQIARRFEVSRVQVYQRWQRLKQTGQRGSLRIGGHRRLRLADDDHRLRAGMQQEPDLTLAEWCERLKTMDVIITVPALWHRLKQLVLTYQKNLENLTRRRARATRRTTAA
jgi:transposase